MSIITSSVPSGERESLLTMPSTPCTSSGHSEMLCLNDSISSSFKVSSLMPRSKAEMSASDCDLNPSSEYLLSKIEVERVSGKMTCSLVVSHRKASVIWVFFTTSCFDSNSSPAFSRLSSNSETSNFVFSASFFPAVRLMLVLPVCTSYLRSNTHTGFLIVEYSHSSMQRLPR